MLKKIILWICYIYDVIEVAFHKVSLWHFKRFLKKVLVWLIREHRAMLSQRWVLQTYQFMTKYNSCIM